jgi:hypothetical protein
MGQQAAAFDTWRNRNKPISQDSNELMGQHTHKKDPAKAVLAKSKKSKSHFTPDTDETLENQGDNATNSTLWDACD